MSKKQHPLISIIIPVYNTATYLEQCMQSILQQTYQQLEIILVDDGSTDSSPQLCARYAKQDSRVQLITQANAGLSAARNAGIQVATGQYLTFVDSDDYVAVDYIAYLLNLCQNHHAQLSICSHIEYYPNHQQPFNTRWPDAVFNSEICLKRMLLEQGFMLSAWGKLYHRSLFAKDPTSPHHPIRFPVGKIHEDIGTTYKLVMNAQQIAYGHQSKYYYRQRTDSIIHQKFSPQKLDIITLTNQMCRVIDQHYPQLRHTTRLRRLRARLGVAKQKLFNR